MKKLQKSLIVWKWVAWLQLKKILKTKQEKIVWFLDDIVVDSDVIWKIDVFESIITSFEIEKIYFAIPSLSDKTKLEHIKNICNKLNKKLFIIPSIVDIIWESVKINFLREMNINDLLFRPIKKYNIDKIKKFINWKTILITWIAWTIWSELLNQCFKYWVKKIIWIDHSEIWIFDISQKYLNKKNIIFYIKSIKDKNWLKNIFKNHKIDLVFNAAAYKHVYQMELNPDEAINNNIFWLKNIIEVSHEYGVKDFCQISTDKAVNPTNIMGASKRIWELLIHQYSKIYTNMNLVSVRFGNVLWSSWSILEIFRKQIKKWWPLTVTDPEVIRYFMSIEEAINLVITSMTLNKRWVIFVLDMGNPVKIIDLAKKFIELSNIDWIKIKIIWLRTWEKLYEELILDKNNDKNTIIDEIFITEDKWNFENILEDIKKLEWLYDKKEILLEIKNIIPEFLHKNCKKIN